MTTPLSASSTAPAQPAAVRSRHRRAAAVVVAATVMGLGSVLGTAPAQAHNYLVSSTPAADTTLTELPVAFDITTNDDLLDVGDTAAFALQVLDAEGMYYGDGCVDIDGPTMTAVPALGEPGDYTVRWQVLSADGHVVSDEFGFAWAPTEELEPSLGAASPPVCGQPAVSPSASPTEDAAAGEPSASVQPSTAAETENTAATDTVPTALWIGGAVLALAAAIGITLAVTGRRKRS